DAGAAVGSAATVRADGESMAFGIPSDGYLRDAVCGGVAFQRACGSIGKLQPGSSLCVGSDDWRKILAALVASLVARRRWLGARIWIGRFLSFAGRLRTAVGEYRPSALFRLSVFTK